MYRFTPREHPDEFFDALVTCLQRLCVLNPVEDCKAIGAIEFLEKALGHKRCVKRHLQI